MKQPRTKYVDRITTGYINQPYLRAAMAVMSGLLASLFLGPHYTDLASHILGYCFIFLVMFHLYFLARAVDTLHVEDKVPQPDELVGMHLDQK
jgi:hypothetical protein